MYVSLTNLVKAAIGGGHSTKTQDPLHAEDADHVYIRGDIANRGPCPGLNALANQGYLPRDGKNLTLPQIQAALMKALHMSKTASAATTNALKPLVRKDGTLDLADTRKHNVVEHDASFTRLDFHEGDNYTFQPYMLQAMLDDADGQTVTLQSLARTFIRRGKESKEAGAPSLSINLWFVAVLQAVTVRNACQLGDLSKETMESVFAEERFPDAVLQNTKPRTMFTLLGNAVGMLYWIIVGPGQSDRKGLHE